MRYLRTIFIGAAMIAITLKLASAAPLAPYGLAPGQYQLLFVTQGTTDFSSTAEATYNSFATAQAAPINAVLADAGITGVTWTAITSTADINASTNAPQQAGTPVYNTLGMLLANSGELYSQPLHAPPEYDQYGNSTFALVVTGSDAAGNALSGSTMGSAAVQVGSSGETSGFWLDNREAFVTGTGTAPIYALSSAFTVLPVPEPSTLALGLLGVVTIGLAARRKSNR